MRRFLPLVSLASVLLVAALFSSVARIPRAAGTAPGSPRFDDVFWKTWGDGKAELAGYDLTFSRYGSARNGTAVTVFVTEPFTNAARVKHERSGGDPADVFQVLKLNLMQDFPTGIYDYNLMSSVFVATEPVNGRVAGTTTKISFSAQEWCGQQYAQLLFDESATRFTSHSYFDGEGDQQSSLEHPGDGLAEDSLLHWARGLAAPVVAPGASVEVPLLRSLATVRLAHREPRWLTARLSRGGETQSVTVPAGEFEVEVMEAALPDRTWTFWVEQAPPRRIVRWATSDGDRAELLASRRLAYWGMSAERFRRALEELGLSPRPARTP